MNAVERAAGNGKRRTAVIVYAPDLRSHHAQRFHDPFHGTFLNGRITGQCTGECLSRQNPGDQPCGGSAVAAVQNRFRSGQSVETTAMNQHGIRCVFDFNAHLPETGDGGKAVCTLQKACDFCGSPCYGAKHNTAVGDGFITRNRNFSL